MTRSSRRPTQRRRGTRRNLQPDRCRVWLWLAIAIALGSAFGSAAAFAGCSIERVPARLDFTLVDMHGREVALADQLGKVLLIDFWATWCGPCRVEIPGFVELVETYGTRGFAVLGISVDDSPAALRAYAEELGMNYPVLIGDGRDDVKEAYGPLIGFPTSVIVDRDGMICHRHVGYSPKQAFVDDIEALL